MIAILERFFDGIGGIPNEFDVEHVGLFPV
jgi:hypothetical protein